MTVSLSWPLAQLAPGVDIDSILIDLILYEDASLVNAAINVLISRYERRATTRAALTEVELLVHPRVVEVCLCLCLRLYVYVYFCACMSVSVSVSVCLPVDDARVFVSWLNIPFDLRRR